MALKVKTLKFVEMNEFIHYLIHHGKMPPEAVEGIRYMMNCFFIPGEFYPGEPEPFLDIYDFLKTLVRSNVVFDQSLIHEPRFSNIAIHILSENLDYAADPSKLKIQTIRYLDSIDLCKAVGGDKLYEIYNNIINISNEDETGYYKTFLDGEDLRDFVALDDFIEALNVNYGSGKANIKKMFEAINVSPDIYVEID